MTPQLTHRHLDVLTEMINIGAGRAAAILNQMLQSHIELSVPNLQVLNKTDVQLVGQRLGGKRLAAIQMGFDGPFAGQSALVFPPESAALLVSLLLGGEEVPFDKDVMRVGALQEMGNIVLNGVMGSFCNILKEHLQYYPPDYREDQFEPLFLRALTNNGQGGHLLMAKAHFQVANHLITGEILILFHFGSFETLLSRIESMFPAPPAGN